MVCPMTTEERLANVVVRMHFGNGIANCMKKRAYRTNELRSLRVSPDLRSYRCKHCGQLHLTSGGM